MVNNIFAYGPDEKVFCVQSTFLAVGQAGKGYYFIGDSAYSLKSFLMVPYDNVVHGTPEDNYNFFHLSCQITIECCFGEIDL